MITRLSPRDLTALVHELRMLPRETPWFEIKVNNEDPNQIGENISALSNGAALVGKAFGYILWGVHDASHEIVGTTFVPGAAKIGNEELENWLARLLTPRLDLQFAEVEIDGKRVVLLGFACASRQPVAFQGVESIRVGSYTKKLKEYPEKERALWRTFETTPFEGCIAAERASDDDVIRLLDYPSYFDLLGSALPSVKQGILEALAADRLIVRTDGGAWDITNLGAVLFAKRLDDFPRLARKAVRVIAYKGTGRLETLKEQLGAKGYANGFEGLVGFVNGLVPSNEIVQQALRRTVPMYPELAVRELFVNALIHQDLSITGTGPMIEIFSDRLEVTNPGLPLIPTERFLDTPPRSRNEALASLMRRVGICEERGSGVDKVVAQCELYQLPAPLFEVTGDAMRAVLFATRPLKKMAAADRIRACYLHACLKYVSREHLTNTTVRARFGIDTSNIAIASRLIKEAVDAGAIVPVDRNASRRHMKYAPWWTTGESEVGT